VLEKAVRWVIIILVIVFDPLAIMMVLAATESLRWEKEQKFERPDESVEPQLPDFLNKLKDRFKKKQDPEPNPTPVDDQHTHIPVETYYAPSVPPMAVVEQKELAEDPMIRIRNGMEDLTNRLADPVVIEELVHVNPNAPGLDVSMDRPGDYLTEAEKESMRRWKEQHPADTIKHQRQLLDQGIISQLPWEKELSLQPDSAPSGNVTGFGTAYPTNPVKGDMFLRVDQMPSVLYKYNGTRWIEVDKKLSDQYAYDEAYIDHLIAKIDSGEYDPDLLSDAERDQIEQRLSRG
jgi:hypothetical protein